MECATQRKYTPLRSSLGDRAGIWASTLCVIHCLFTPFVLSFSAVLAHALPSEERVHRTLAIVIALIGALALIRGFRIHRRVAVFSFMAVGLSCICAAAWLGDSLPHHWMEVTITFVGSGFMISAHRLNHTFCKDCVCSNPQEKTSAWSNMDDEAEEEFS